MKGSIREVNLTGRNNENRQSSKGKFTSLIVILGLLVVITLGFSVTVAAKTELTFWGGDLNPVTKPIFMAALSDFQKENPGIEIKFEGIPFAVLDDKCMAALAARSGPDILLVNSVTLGLFIERGYLQAIDDFLTTSKEFNQKDFFQDLWKAHVVYRGKSWGIPVDTGTRALIYNKDLLQKLGLPLFKEETTWEEFKKAALLATQDIDGDGITDQFGYAYGGGEKWVSLYENYGMFAVQNQGHFVNEDVTKSTANSPEIIEAVEFHVSLDEAALKGSISCTDQQEYQNIFAKNKILGWQGGHWAVDYIETLEPVVNYGITLLKKKQIGSSTGGWIVALPMHTKGEKLKAAYRFMEFYARPENLTRFTTIMPTTKSGSKIAMKAPKYDLFKKVLPFSRHPVPLCPDLPEIAKVLNDEVQNALLGRKTVQQAMDDVTKTIDQILKRR